jgi:hypothetical protein
LANYSAKYRTYRDIQLFHHELPVGELKYDKWYTIQSKIILSGKEYQLIPTNGWQPKVLLVHDNVVLAETKIGWGKITLMSRLDNTPREFQIKRKSWFKSQFSLVDETEQELITLEGKFSWKTWNLNYQMDVSPALTTQHLPAFLLTIMHAINYQMSSNQRVTPAII